MIALSFRLLIVLSLLCVFGIPATLSGDINSLPDVDIGSDEVIKIPLPKKQAVYQFNTMPDTLQSFLPPLFCLKQKQVIAKQIRFKAPVVSIDFSSAGDYSLHSTYYPSSRKLRQISLLGQFNQPQAGHQNLSIRASLNTELTSKLSFQHAFSVMQTETDNLQSDSFGYGLTNHAANLKLGAAHFSLIKSRLVAEQEKQNSSSFATTKNSYWGLENEHQLTWNSITLNNSFLLHKDYLGVSLKYRLPIANILLPDVNAGIMTDFVRFLPAVDIHKRVTISPGQYLEIANRSGLRSTDHNALRREYLWSAIPFEHKLRITPVDLFMGLYDTTAQPGKPSSFGITNNLVFCYNQPDIAIANVAGLTQVRYVRSLVNETAITSRWDFADASISQDIRLKVENTHSRGWGRSSYSPLVLANTEILYRIGDVEFELTLAQEYLSKDENDNPLPAVFDMGLKVRYPLTDTILLTSWWQNIFNTPYHFPGDIPQSGRALGIRLSYRPD